MPTALVTGSNRGIGLALCQAYRARDVSVIAACRRSSPDLDALGAQVETGVDVTSDRDLAALLLRVGGPIDHLVLNAGVLQGDDLERLDLGRVREQLEVNAVAPLRVVHALLPRLRSGSKIALLTSRMGSIADNTSGGYYGYRMSKAALNAAGMSLAIDLRARGIAVAILHPGFVRTDMTGGSGNVEPKTAAAMLLDRIDALTLETSGTFWHANGERLPW